MTENGVRPGAHKAGVIVVGLAATAGGLLSGLILAFLAGLNCRGSDASSPSDSWVCEGNLDESLVIAGWALAGAGPLLGMVVSLARERWRPLWVGIGVGALGLAILGFVGSQS